MTAATDTKDENVLRVGTVMWTNKTSSWIADGIREATRENIGGGHLDSSRGLLDSVEVVEPHEM